MTSVYTPCSSLCCSPAIPTLALLAAAFLCLAHTSLLLCLGSQGDIGCLPALKSHGWLEWGWMQVPMAMFLGVTLI